MSPAARRSTASAARGPAPTTIADLLRRTLETCGRSEYEIAKTAGISRQVLSDFAHGERNPTLETLERLFPVLGLAVVGGARRSAGRRGAGAAGSGSGRGRGRRARGNDSGAKGRESDGEATHHHRAGDVGRMEGAQLD